MRALAYFLPLLAQKRWSLALTLVLALLTMAAGIGLLGLSGWFITATGLSTAGALFNIIGPSAGIRGLSFVRIASRYGERYAGHAATLSLVARTRGWVFERLFRQVPLPQAFGRADVVSRLVADLDMLDNIFLVALGPMTTAALTALLMGLGLGLVLPGAALPYTGLFLAATIAVPALLLVASRRPGAEAVAASARLRDVALEGIDGHQDLVLFGRLGRFRADAAAAIEALAAARRRLGRHAASGSAAVQLLAVAALFAVLLIGLEALRQGEIDGPMLVGVLLAVLASFEASQTLIRSVSRLSASIAAAERVMALAEGPVTALEVSEPLVPPRRGEIELAAVRFAYPGQSAVLAGLELRIAPGERVAIVGPSGSGKSTIAQILVRLLELQGGAYRLDGADVGRMAVDEVRRRVTLMTQDAPVFGDTLRANLRMGRAEATDAELWAALDEVGLGDEIRAVGGGLELVVGEAGRSLSVGQSRRVALARTLLTGADVLVLDEPTTGLDAAAAGVFLGALGGIAKGRGLVVITHFRALAGFDRVLELRAGTLHEVSVPSEGRNRW